MTKVVNYRHTEEYMQLCEDIAAGFIEHHKERIDRQQEFAEWHLRFKHGIAEEILMHPAYKKYSKGNRDFIDNFKKDVGLRVGKKVPIGKTTFYDMLQLYEAQPNIEKVIAKAPTTNKALEIFLGRGVSRVSESTCKHCSLHCK